MGYSVELTERAPWAAIVPVFKNNAAKPALGVVDKVSVPITFKVVPAAIVQVVLAFVVTRRKVT